MGCSATPQSRSHDHRSLVPRGAGMTARATLLAEALAHHSAGRLAEAEAAYARALALAPGRPTILHNLGVVTAARGQHAAALAHLDAAIAVEPEYASAHYNRGVALQQLGRSREAIGAFARAAAIDPGNSDAHRALGFGWLALGERGRALDHFARTYELRRGEDRSGAAMASLTHATRGKLQHDASQLRYLAGRRRDGKRFELLARAYDAAARDHPEAIAALSAEQVALLGEDYNTAIHMAAAPELPGGAINPALDRNGIAAAYNAHDAHAVQIDDLLTPQTLTVLRRYLLESTIWHDFSHIGGFVASYLEDGLACPLLLRIADELRGALPSILGPHPLSQAWAFKGLGGGSAVAAHADDAAVSVNLWLTPDAANLDPSGGGLVVCRAAPPEDWEIRGYDADMAVIMAFMSEHEGDALRVPYGENRAVIFESRLFHRSDAPHFAEGYENHRINLTLLFGRAA